MNRGVEWGFALRHHSCRAQTRARTALLVGLRTVALYAFAAWVYIALVALVHPRTLVLQLTHLTKWPHEDTFGEVSFAVSLVCFYAHALLCDSSPRRSRGSAEPVRDSGRDSGRDPAGG